MNCENKLNIVEESIDKLYKLRDKLQGIMVEIVMLKTPKEEIEEVFSKLSIVDDAIDEAETSLLHMINAIYDEEEEI